MDNDNLVSLQQRIISLIGEQGSIALEATTSGYDIVLPGQVLFDRYVLASVQQDAISISDFLKQQLTQQISGILGQRIKNRRWVGEYGKLSPGILEREGIDLARVLTDQDYLEDAVGQMHGKVNDGNALLEELATALLHKSDVLLEREERSGDYYITYKLSSGQHLIEFEGVFHRTGAWPVNFRRTTSQHRQAYQHARPETKSKPMELKNMPLVELRQLTGEVAKYPDQRNLRIGGNLFERLVKKQIRETGKRELSDKLNLSEAFGVFEKYGLRFYRGNQQMTQEGLLAYLEQSVPKAPIAGLEERTIEFPFDWGHGNKATYSSRITPKPNLTTEQCLFLVRGNIDRLGVTLDSNEFIIKPDDPSNYGTNVARLLRDGNATSYSWAFVNELVRFLKNSILAQGRQLASESPQYLETRLGRIEQITISGKKGYLGQLIEAVDGLFAAINGLPSWQQQGYREATRFIVRDKGSGQTKELDFLALVEEFSKSLRTFNQDNIISGVLSTAMSTYAFEQSARGISLHPELYKGRIGILVEYKPIAR